VIRLVLAAVVLLWGAFGMAGALLIREAPSLRRARLLGGLCGELLGLALLAGGVGHGLPALLFVLAGLGCGAGWLLILYANSLHNTTM